MKHSTFYPINSFHKHSCNINIRMVPPCIKELFETMLTLKKCRKIEGRQRRLTDVFRTQEKSMAKFLL